MKKNKKKEGPVNFFETPKETLKYRGLFKYINYVVIFFLIIFLSLFVASTIAFFKVNGTDQKMAMNLIINSAFFGMFCALSFSFWYYHLRPMTKAVIKIFNTSLIYSDSKKEYSIYFEDIESAEYISFLGMSRLVVKTKEQAIFSYSMWISNTSKLLETIHEYDNNLFGNSEFKKIKKKMILSGQNIKRCEDFCSKERFVKTLFHLLVIPFAFVLILLLKQNSIVINSSFDYYGSVFQLFSFVVIASSGIYLFISNSLISSYMLKNKDDKIDSEYRDLTNEAQTYKKLYPWYVGTMSVLMALVIITDLNLYGVMNVSNSSVPLNLLKGERVWVDKRFNCNDCKFKIKTNDIIVYLDKESSKEIFAKIINTEPESSRLPASMKNTKNTLMIQTAKGISNTFISYSQIIGKKI